MKAWWRRRKADAAREESQAQKELSAAQHSIRYFFTPKLDLSVVCDLLELSKAAPSLKVAIAYARVAEAGLMACIDECDERTIAARYISAALAEFKYQLQKEKS
jgi:hypothetical protein